MRTGVIAVDHDHAEEPIVRQLVVIDITTPATPYDSDPDIVAENFVMRDDRSVASLNRKYSDNLHLGRRIWATGGIDVTEVPAQTIVLDDGRDSGVSADPDLPIER